MPFARLKLCLTCLSHPKFIRSARLADRSSLNAVLFSVLISFTVGCQQSFDPKPQTDVQQAQQTAEISDRLQYLGAATCIRCHPQQGEGFSLSAHAHALAEIDIDREPPDGEFYDSESQRNYRIYRDQKSLRQEESIQTEQGEKLILCDLPMRYVIGSGHFSKSYLVEREGFLFESPITWFSALQQWKLSPGYEHSNLGFQRPAERKCLFCHAGQIEPVDRSPQRLRLPVLAIDCERCHGAGEAHVRKWEAAAAGDNTSLPETIFHPAKADRQRSEDVCAQCHLHVAATIEHRNQRMEDFRPGDRLTDYVGHYMSTSSREEMEVVGHVEQLRMSRCYQADQRLSCLTCHSAHNSGTPTTASYRQTCVECHSEEACRAEPAARFAVDVQDNCVHCHMPRSPTEIPHFAFTHHRIGIHQSRSDHGEGYAQPDELVPVPGGREISSAEEDRNRGLAYLQYSDAPGQFKHAGEYRQRSLQLLQRALRNGISDPELEAAMARLMFGVEPSFALSHAAKAATDLASPEAWTTACFTTGATYYALNRPLAAQPWLERGVQLRPTGDLYVMLSDCRKYSRDLPAALAAARMAHHLAPDRPAYCQLLIELLRQNGRPAEAEALIPRLEALRQYRRQLDSGK